MNNPVFSYTTPSVEFLGAAPSNEVDLLKMIELTGRTCYKSEDKITEESSYGFFKRILGKTDNKGVKHFSIFEHSNIVFKISNERILNLFKEIINIYNRASIFRTYFDSFNVCFYIGGNLRSWIEIIHWIQTANYPWVNKVSKYLKYLFLIHYGFIYTILIESGIWSDETTEIDGNIVNEKEQIALLKRGFDLPIFIFRFVTDRGITHEIVRHRTLQFSQESTRYINYHKRLGITIDSDLKNMLMDYSVEDSNTLDTVYKVITDFYNHITGTLGIKPQNARDILPNSLKSEIIVSGYYGIDSNTGYCKNSTAYISNDCLIDPSTGWKRFLKMRLSEAAHPKIRSIACAVQSVFEKRLEIDV